MRERRRRARRQELRLRRGFVGRSGACTGSAAAPRQPTDRSTRSGEGRRTAQGAHVGRSGADLLWLGPPPRFMVSVGVRFGENNIDSRGRAGGGGALELCFSGLQPWNSPRSSGAGSPCGRHVSDGASPEISEVHCCSRVVALTLYGSKTHAPARCKTK